MCGRLWFPMWSRSRNPAVMARAKRSPFRSSSALVATVVPILMAAMLCSEWCVVGIVDERRERAWVWPEKK